MNPEWDTCEDCMGTGGMRNLDPDGDCGSCGGRGRMPANQAARDHLSGQARERALRYERAARREYEDR